MGDPTKTSLKTHYEVVLVAILHIPAYYYTKHVQKYKSRMSYFQHSGNETHYHILYKLYAWFMHTQPRYIHFLLKCCWCNLMSQWMQDPTNFSVFQWSEQSVFTQQILEMEYKTYRLCSSVTETTRIKSTRREPVLWPDWWMLRNRSVFLHGIWREFYTWRFRSGAPFTYNV